MQFKNCPQRSTIKHHRNTLRTLCLDESCRPVNWSLELARLQGEVSEETICNWRKNQKQPQLLPEWCERLWYFIPKSTPASSQYRSKVRSKIEVLRGYGLHLAIPKLNHIVYGFLSNASGTLNKTKLAPVLTEEATGMCPRHFTKFSAVFRHDFCCWICFKVWFWWRYWVDFWRLWGRLWKPNKQTGNQRVQGSKLLKRWL